MQIPLHYNPRHYQVNALSALEAGVQIAVLCWARRAGKDLTSFAYSIKKMVETPMNVVLIFPDKKQGKAAFWENIENDGWKTLDHIPKELIARQDNTEMVLTLKNGSTFRILGTGDPDALRGANAKIYILSEFVDIPLAVMDVIRPITAVNGGQIIIISTPKIDGISGASFKKLFNRALKNWTQGAKTQYASLVTAREYLSDEVLEELRQETIEKYGNDFFWRQEYLCDWGQVSSASYYGSALKMVEKKNHKGLFPHNPSYPVFTSWDLGMSDMMAITFFQYIQKVPYIIDYFEINNTGYGPLVSYITQKPYNYGGHFLPHDATVRDSDAIQRQQKLRDLGLLNVFLLKREGKQLGINRAIEWIAKCFFNEPTTAKLVEKLLLYKKKFNPHTGDYEGPEHKTESHAADTVRGMFKAIEEFFNKETGEFLYSPANRADTYESELVQTPAQYQYY